MIGRTIAHYQVLEKLGEGGMGVVYKARDTHLDRFVAIKVLPPEKVADPERKRRFVQEAKAASALNHPNIITIHDIAQESGCDFMVMQFVAGKGLDQLIPRKGMPLSQALQCAVEIADALATAHGAGIVHRDLKPSNIMVTEKGHVKVLDFGLAKLTETAPFGEDEPTRTLRPRTEEGAIVGTVAYMSPEQAQGKVVDARSDIFSFGSVVYEMVTGRRAFQGDTKISTLAAIINREPAPAGSEVPQELQRIIARCLRKDPARRFQHMEDLKVALEELKEESDSGQLVARERLPRGHWPRAVRVAGAVVALLALLAVVLWLRRWRGAPEEAPLVTTMITSEPAWEGYPSFSPDGASVAYMRMPEDLSSGDIYVKLIGEEKPLRVTETKDFAVMPEWSPDGRTIAFARLPRLIQLGQRVSLWLVPPIGGTEKKAGEANWPGLTEHPISWTADSASLVIVDRENPQQPFALYLLEIKSGVKRRLTSPPAEFLGDTGGAVSPDGRSLVFSRRKQGNSADLYRLELSPGMTPLGEPKRLTSGVLRANWPAWTPDGQTIVFCSHIYDRATLWRVPADGSRKPVPLPFVGLGSYGPAIARTGKRLAYIKHVWDPNIWRVQLAAPDRAAGPPSVLIQSTVADSHPKYAPNGRWIAFHSLRSGRDEFWICGSDGANPRQLTSSGISSGFPQWSPDSQQLAFVSEAEGNPEVYVVGVEGGPSRRLTNHPATDNGPKWSADGRWVYFNSIRTGKWQVWRVPAGGGEAALAERGRLGEESADGKQVFYTRPEATPYSSLWRAPVEGGQGERVLEGLVRRDFAVTAHGIHYFGAEGQGSSWFLKFRDAATGRTSTLAPVWTGTASGVTVSAHGVKSRLDSGFDQATSFFRNLLLAAAMTREVISFVRTI